jgi:NAD(P)-dependent dehydrogenase (short-subunit alcohol dehydrogenase family)
MTDTYLTERVPEQGAIVFVTSAGGLYWERPEHRAELQPMIDAKNWDDMVAVAKILDDRELGDVKTYIYSKRILNYYIALKVEEFGKKKIRINAVMPASTDSGMKADFVAQYTEEGFNKSVGLAGRLAEPKEMGQPLVFLNSDMASYTSGVLMDVDYGQHLMATTGLISHKTDFKLF